MRPVICICNNPYAPALRELKAVAKVFTVPEVIPKRMTARLETICRREGLAHDRHALTDLCRLADGDIRSCLMTLQFLQASHHGVTSRSVADSNVGTKDQSLGLFSVMEDIFHRQEKAKYLTLLAAPKEKPTQAKSVKCDPGYQYILQRVEMHPDQERLWEGCFEHYASLRFPDIDGTRAAACADWLAWGDRIQHLAFAAQATHLRRFIPFGIAHTHLQCASARRPLRLEFPRGFQNHRQALDAHRTVLQTYCSGVPLTARPFTRPTPVVLDTLSLLLRILSPKWRLGSGALMSAKEKADLRALTLLYVHHGLTFVGRSDGAQLSWPLDLEIDRLVAFPGLPASHQPLPSALRQVLSREICHEKVRQAAQAAVTARTVESANQAKQKPEAKPTPKPLPTLPKPIDPGPRSKAVRRDFFGRVITDAAARDASAGPLAAPSPVSRTVRFQFHEGFTNAIRRPVYLDDFL